VTPKCFVHALKGGTGYNSPVVFLLQGYNTEVDMDEIVNKVISAYTRTRIFTYLN